MDFSLTDEQAMLAESVARFVDAEYGFERRMRIVESDNAFDSGVWQSMVEMGWTALPFAESDGGFDGGATELMLLMEQFGRGLVVEPYLPNVVLAGGVLRRAPGGELRDRLIAGIIDGSRQLAVAFAEPESPDDPASMSSQARATGGKFELSGRKHLVLNAGAADTILVPARSGDGAEDITVFAVDRAAPGLAIAAYPTVDGHAAAEIELQDVAVDDAGVIGELHGGLPLLQGAIDDGILAVCAEGLGIMQALQDKTVAYTKDRVQFGVPIGSFQALQHRMVDMLMACEETRSLLYWAVMLQGSNDARARRAIHALKFQVGRAGRQVGQEAVQLHGGMGVSWEVDIAHYFKRLTVIQRLFGNADRHLDAYAAD